MSTWKVPNYLLPGHVNVCHIVAKGSWQHISQWRHDSGLSTSVNSLEVKVEVEVNIRPTVSWPVCPGVRLHLRGGGGGGGETYTVGSQRES
jgi:hypothetical protein